MIRYYWGVCTLHGYSDQQLSTSEKWKMTILLHIPEMGRDKDHYVYDLGLIEFKKTKRLGCSLTIRVGLRLAVSFKLRWSEGPNRSYESCSAANMAWLSSPKILRFLGTQCLKSMRTFVFLKPCLQCAPSRPVLAQLNELRGTITLNSWHIFQLLGLHIFNKGKSSDWLVSLPQKTICWCTDVSFPM